MEVKGENAFERIGSLRNYKISNPPLNVIHTTEFTIKLPFETSVYMAFCQYTDEWMVFIPTHDPSKFILQARVDLDNTADLQYINNHKDGKIIPVRGGGKFVLHIWDWFAKLVGITSTCVTDMSHLCLQSITDKPFDNDEYNSISLRFLSMILNKENLTWYEQQGYVIPDKNNFDKNMEYRNLFFNLEIAQLMGIIKHDIEQYCDILVKHDIYNDNLPYLIEVYVYCFYNTEIKIKDFLAQLWQLDVHKYSALEKLVLTTEDPNIHHFLRVICDGEMTFVKKHCEITE